MLIIPAIDIKNGNCVRLLQGDPDKETIYSDNPVEMAKKFEGMGAELIHVVDLDGAFEGRPVNFDIVASIAQSVSIPIEIGGGIRNSETIEKYLQSGIKRIILGTVLLQDEYKDLISQYKDNIIAGIDAKDSMVATHGWKSVSSAKAVDVIDEMIKIGLNEIIYTDISTDGMLTGPNYSALKDVGSRFKNIRLIASGGVSTLDDIKKLNELRGFGVIGCIVGKAIYDGRVSLPKAIDAVK